MTRHIDTMITATPTQSHTSISSEVYCMHYCMDSATHCAYSYNFVTDECLVFEGCTRSGCSYDYHDTGCDDWYTTYRECHAECAALGTMTNGAITTSGYTSTVTCAYGYETLTPILTCNTLGQWESNNVVILAPQCFVIQCPTVSLSNGNVAYSGGQTWNATVSFTCNTGYDLTGETFAICQGDKTWNASIPVCVIVDCLSPGTPVNGNTIKIATTYLETATYTCNIGYSRNGSSTTQCEASGNWSNPVPTCDIVDCFDPPLPVNGNVSFTTTTYLSSATFNCDTGYYLGSPASTACGSTGAWGVTNPICTLHDCLNLADPANGTFVAPNGTTYETIAYFNCDPGYYLTPSEVNVYCQADGTWNSTIIPTCSLLNCGPLPSIDNGISAVTGTLYLDVATITCYNGFESNDTSPVICQADGTWENPLPACLLVDCGIPQAPPENGSLFLTEGTLYGSKVSFNCTPGLAPYPVSARTCLSDKTWTFTNVTCEVPPLGGVFTTPAALVIYVMPCLCVTNRTFVNMTQDEIIDQLVQEMAINTQNTTLATSALICRPDSRQSSLFIGLFGVAFLAAVFGFLVLLDILTICKNCCSTDNT